MTNVLNELHIGTREITVIGGLRVGTMGPSQQYLSNARRGNANNDEAKINGSAALLQRLFAECKVNALYSSENPHVYVEYKREKNNYQYCGLYDDKSKTISWKDQKPPSHEQFFPLLMFALHPLAPFPEVKQSFAAAKQEYLSLNRVSDANAFKLCDNFYFELKNHLGTGQVKVTEDMSIASIKQACRTGQMKHFPELDGLALPPLAEVPEPPLEQPQNSSHNSKIKYSDCKNGRYKIDYFWNCDDEPFIPGLDFLDGFVPVPAYYNMVTLIQSQLGEVKERMDKGEIGLEAIGNNYVNAIFTGKPGTGKTTIAYALAATFGLPIRTVSLSKNTEEDTCATRS